MADVSVIIVYSDILESVSVDGVKIEDIYAIKNKPINEWFLSTGNRDGWEGLITEIKKLVNDENVSINFEFQGSEDDKKIFEECIRKLGFESNTDGLTSKEIADRYLTYAKNAEHEGQYKRALGFYLKAADIGESTEAQVKVGDYYDNEEHYQDAFKWYKKAAKQGNSEAQNILGIYYASGIGTKQDYEEALKWHTKAAEQNNVDAQLNLGYYFEHGICMQQNFEEAVRWYSRAAEQNNAYAQYAMGICYEYGTAVNQDYKEAVRWYKKAAEQGNEDAFVKVNALNKMQYEEPVDQFSDFIENDLDDLDDFDFDDFD